MTLLQDGQYTPGREARWEEGNKLIIDYLKNLDSKKKLRVLDIGCGEGYNYQILCDKMSKEHLAKNKLDYYAIDNNPKLCNTFEHTRIKFTLGDINNLDKLYQKNYFDVIIASEIIEHVVDTDRLILSIKKILKDDGRVFLTTPNLGSWHSILSLILGYQPLSTEVSCVRSEFGKLPIAKTYYYNNVLMHVRAFSLRGLLDFLNYHGFKTVKISGGGYRKIDKILFSKIFIHLSPILKVIIKKEL